MSAPGRLPGRLLLAGVLAGAGTPAFATDWQAEAGAGRETLSGGRAAWTQVDAALYHQFSEAIRIGLQARRTERFGFADSELGASLGARLDADWSAGFNAAASGTHQILPRWSLGGEVQRRLGDGWVLGAGLRHTRYDQDNASALSIAVERYIGAWRLAATATQTRLQGASGAAAGRLQADRYFLGERAKLGLIVASGRELDNLGAGTILVSNVESFALVGQWPLAAGWAVHWDVGAHRRGSLYRRSGGRLGVRLDW